MLRYQKGVCRYFRFCTSPSKTFNLASMLISNIFIPNQILRRKFCKEMDRAGISQLSVLGLVATEAAYAHGDEWYAAMKNYVRDNIAFARAYVEEKNLPGVRYDRHAGEPI